MKPRHITNSGIRPSHTKAPALIVAAIAMLALPVGAVTVLNPSFEANALGDGAVVVGATSWTTITNSNINLSNGVTFDPVDPWFTGTNGTGTPMGGAGENVFSVAVNVGVGNANVNRGLSQTLTDTITAGTTYTMTVAVGDYKNKLALDFQLDLAYFNGTSTVLLASYFGAAAELTSDRLTDFSVSFTALPLQSYLGQNLRIQIRGDQRADGLGENIAFDNVRVTSALIPEPSTALLGGLGMLVLLRRRR